MLLRLERRANPSRAMMVLSPFLAIALTLAIGAIIFAALGKNPGEGLYYFFVQPLTEAWSFEEILVKMTPLAIIGIGLSICFLSQNWNIGAEGQFVMGALAGSALPVLFPEWQSALIFPVMILFALLGGMAYGLIPAILKVRFGANEILTSLMLVYVAGLFLDWIVRGPWRNPQGFNMPESVPFHEGALAPVIGLDRLNIGFVLAIILAFIALIYLSKTMSGFGIRLTGSAPRAARFAGFSPNKTTLLVLGLSGALAGLAGILEVAGPIGQLRPSISPGYGFTAIIVAFLGRLNPVGVLFAAFILSLTYIGGENAQIAMNISNKMTNVFQGILLFLILACDTLITYRLRFASARKAGAAT